MSTNQTGSPLRRFEPTHKGVVAEHPQGRFVLFSDYADAVKALRIVEAGCTGNGPSTGEMLAAARAVLSGNPQAA